MEQLLQQMSRVVCGAILERVLTLYPVHEAMQGLRV